MRLRESTIGGLNLFGAEPGATDEDDVTPAQGLADIATIATLQHRTTLDATILNDQLGIAQHRRIVIERPRAW